MLLSHTGSIERGKWVEMLRIGEMAARLGVTVATLRRWERTGKLRADQRTLGGHRRYAVAPPQGGGATILYARVSSADQRGDLERQKVRLLDRAKREGWSEILLLSDLGSRLNFRKPGLLKILDLLLRGKVQRLVIENKDRLLRFGAELVFRLCKLLRVEVVICDGQENRGFEAELARDVLEIITVFSARLYGARSRDRRKENLQAIWTKQNKAVA